MATLPKNFAEDSALSHLVRPYGWERIHQGKVRDTYVQRDNPRLRVIFATNRLSIFDFVLPTEVPLKGAVLTALTHFWLTTVFSDIKHQLISLAPKPFPPEQSLLVHTVQMQPYELILRHHIGGSVWREYQSQGTASGHTLPQGLIKWQKLNDPIFTPSTKEQEGHDVNITANEYLSAMGQVGIETLKILSAVYRRAYEYAQTRGVLILDTKLEVGGYQNDQIVIADEIITPDSSRFTTQTGYEQAMASHRDPVFYDKQPVRDWGSTLAIPFGGTGMNTLNPSNPDHLAFVHGLKVPREVVDQTTHRYLEIFGLLTGMQLTEYQRTRMGIKN